jgi:CheY-like chemotaxis protein
MSHEIRTPMNAILGFVSILSRGEEDAKRKRYFEIITSSGQSLLSIINDILDFSKIESGKISFEMLPYKSSSIFMETALLFDAQASEKNIVIEKKISNNLPEHIITDKARLSQVLVNLLSNAIKFTPERGKIVFEVSYNAEKKRVLCSVLDTGIGISPQHQESIFHAFEQADNSITRKFGGTGLGLAICRKIIQIMQGELFVESELGKGSRFYFEIPLESDEVLETLTEETLQINSKTMLKGKVLVVEDNISNQTLIGIILQEAGVAYEIANDGQEGVDKYKSGNYNLVLMDENMPKMNGIEATAEIRNFQREHNLDKTAIVAVTANALLGDRERFLKAGADDYITKPYSFEKILELLKKYL